MAPDPGEDPPRIAFITVGDPARLTGGYLYHREVFARLRARGVAVDEVVASGAGLAEQLAAADAFGRSFDPGPYDAVVVDALARAVCAPWVDGWRAARPLVAMVHELPSVAGAAGPDERAREAPLLRADRLIAVSEDGARTLAGRGADPARIVVASGGLDRLAGFQARGFTLAGGDERPFGEWRERSPRRAERAPTPASVTRASAASVLCVAQWIPRKGLAELGRAWARAARPGWRLELVGEDGADPGYAAEVRAALAPAPAGSVAVRGALDDEGLAAAYGAAALFALPSRYEGYGLVFAEAMAWGLPVVACAVGPVPALVGPAAGLLVPPGDEGALAAALARLMGDEALRGRMAAAALARAAELPTWDDCAGRFLAAVQGAIRGRRGGGGGG